MYYKLMNESLKVLIENRKALFKALIIPLIILLIVNIFMPTANAEGRIVFENNSQRFIFLTLIIIMCLINVLIAVSVHRIVLIKDDISLQKSITPTKRELNFFLKSLLLGIVVGLVFAIVFLLLSKLLEVFISPYGVIIAIFLALLLIFIILSRFSMVFPAIAIDEKFGFSDAWVFTENYKFLSLFMVIIFPIIISVLITFVYGMVIGFFVGVVSSHFSVFYILLNLFITVLVISCLSVTYAYIKEETNKKIVENKEKE